MSQVDKRRNEQWKLILQIRLIDFSLQRVDH